MMSAFPLAMAVTNFGESVVLLTTTFAVSTWFWLSHQRRLALVCLAAIGGCAATMIALKLAFLTCGHLVLGGTVQTPSGHSSMAALFYGAAALTAGHLSPSAERYRLPMLGAAFLFALLIGLSRVYIHAHTPQEVAIGLLIGFSWLIGFAWLLRFTHASAVMPPVAILCLLAVLYGGLLTFTMLGRHMSVEGLLWHISRILQLRWGVCTP
jgi:membrane-associated phospholipid phosphatase